MTPPRVVGARQWQAAAIALQSGQVVAVPGDGAYHLAVLPAARASLTALGGRGMYPRGANPMGMVVGSRAQAVGLAPGWSNETANLTDRMWPGPLVVIVPAGGDIVSIAMPASRPLRALARSVGPLVAVALCRADGTPLRDPQDVASFFSSDAVACVLDGGTCRGDGPTVVDCTRTPPIVRRVGALPESYVDAALMMANRRRTWFKKRDSERR